jgi:hypothetical protein
MGAKNGLNNWQQDHRAARLRLISLQMTEVTLARHQEASGATIPERYLSSNTLVYTLSGAKTQTTQPTGRI